MMDIYTGRVKHRKAMDVAKDVLEQIRLNKYSPRFQAFVDERAVKWGHWEAPVQTSGMVDLDLHLQKVEYKRCQVCMLGAVWLSAVKLFDDFMVPSGMDGSVPSLELNMYDCESDPTMSPGAMLAHIFGSDYPYMEAAFEAGMGFFDEYDGHIERSRFRDAVRFGKRHETAKKRMQAICRNIIRNKGRFVPPKKLTAVH